MKNLLRWTTKLSIVSGAVLSSLFSLNLSALAVPEAEIAQKLTPIPVFTVADAQGSPLVASTNEDEKVAGVFMSREDAQGFIDKLKAENAELASQVSVVPVSLKDIYDLDLANSTDKSGLDFAYIPEQSEVEIAKTLLSQQGKEYKGGVPLFVARGGKDKGYLTIQQGDQQIIPFFFEQEQLEAMLTRLRQEQPDLAASVTVEVAFLEGVLEALHSEDNNDLLDNLVLVPSTESLQFLQSLQQQNSNSRNSGNAGGGNR